jgi:cell division protein FtsL
LRYEIRVAQRCGYPIMSLFKVVLLLFLLMLAYGLAVILLRRLTQTAQQLANLRQQLARNDERLSGELRNLHHQQERLRVELEVEKEKSPDEAKDS